MTATAVGAALPRGGRADVVYLLLLLQAGFGLLAMIGELVFMGNPLYAVLPVARSAALFVVAAKVVTGRRWAIVTAIVLETMGLAGVGLSFVAGLLPMLTRTVTLVGLLTEIAVPAAVIYLGALLLGQPHRVRPPMVRPVPAPVPPPLSAPAPALPPTAVDPWADGLPAGFPRPLPPVSGPLPPESRPLPPESRPLPPGPAR